MDFNSGKQPSIMKHDFSKVATANIGRSKFDLSHKHLTTCPEAGVLYPIFCQEVLPGDTHKLQASIFGRLATPIYPLMDNLFADVHFWAVPYRLIWNNFKKFMGEQVDPGDSIDFLIPQITTPPGTGFLEDELYDHFGIPTKEVIENPNNLIGRAYNLILNEWYRDENLQDSHVVDKDDGPDAIADYSLKKRGKRADYFTSCLPWAQKGDAVSLPIGTSAPITGIGMANATYGVINQAVHETDSTGTTIYANSSQTTDSSNKWFMEEDPNSSGKPNARVDLTNATASTINEIREAFKIQKYLEINARSGTRYTEIIKGHFSVTSPDARLQRPEYLGGGTQNINMQPVAQTSETSGTPLSTLSAVGTVQGSGGGFNKSFTEHTIIIGLVSFRADLSYQQGLDRMHTRRTLLDHYWPVLAHLGEQAVLSKEIFADGAAGDQDVFGYQERWAEYRHRKSQVTGAMRSNHSLSLDAYHLSEDFATRPTLGNAFIKSKPPIDRVIAVPSEDHFLLDVYFDYQADRPMPANSTPSLSTHF